MDRLTAAHRKYAEILDANFLKREPGDRYVHFPVRRLQAWFDKDVCPAIADIWNRPTFRENASWSLRRLCAGAVTPERKLVDEIDKSIVDSARALMGALDAAGYLEKRTQLRDATFNKDSVQLSKQLFNLSLDTDAIDVVIRMNQVEGLADHDWIDLVSADDFFWPTAGIEGRQPGQPIANANFPRDNVSLNPHLNRALRQTGDLIVAAMNERICCFVGSIESSRNFLLRNPNVKRTKRVSRELRSEKAAWDNLCAKVQELRSSIIDSAAAQLRNAYACLVQVQANFRPDVDIDWLVLSDEAIRDWHGRLAHAVFSQREFEVVDQIALSLREVARHMQELPPGQTLLDEAIATQGLVLSIAQRTAWWEGQVINVDWKKQHSREWELLHFLALRVSRQQPVVSDDLFPEGGAGRSSLPSLKLRLCRLLPKSLRDEIASIRIPGEYGAYVLRLLADRVHVIGTENVRSRPPIAH